MSFITDHVQRCEAIRRHIRDRGVAEEMGAPMLGRSKQRQSERIAELEARVAELEAEVAQRRDAEDRRAARFRILAHELKSPLATVLQMLYFLDTQELSEHCTRAVAAARRRATSALQMVRDLLELVRLGQGRTDVDEEASCLPVERIPDLVEAHLPAAEKNGVALHLELEAGSAAIAVAGKDFDLIFNNLVSNAVRYSKRDGSEGRVWVRTWESEDSFSLSVQDEGIGISEADQAKLFDEFFRSADAKKQTVSGSGLGLALTKMLIDTKGGNLLCESQLGVGTKFTVRMPRVPVV